MCLKSVALFLVLANVTRASAVHCSGVIHHTPAVAAGDKLKCAAPLGRPTNMQRLGARDEACFRDGRLIDVTVVLKQASP